MVHVYLYLSARNFVIVDTDENGEYLVYDE